MIDDSVQIRCPRCKSKFRDKARRVVDGYSRSCPHCEGLVFFNEDAPNEELRVALRTAAKVRKAVKQEAASNVMVTESDVVPAIRSRQQNARSKLRNRSF